MLRRIPFGALIGLIVTTLFMGFAASWVFLYPLSFHAAGQWTDTTAAIFHASVLLVGLSIVTWCFAVVHTVVGPGLHAVSTRAEKAAADKAAIDGCDELLVAFLAQPMALVTIADANGRIIVDPEATEADVTVVMVGRRREGSLNPCDLTRLSTGVGKIFPRPRRAMDSE